MFLKRTVRLWIAAVSQIAIVFSLCLAQGGQSKTTTLQDPPPPPKLRPAKQAQQEIGPGDIISVDTTEVLLPVTVRDQNGQIEIGRASCRERV